MTIEFQFQPYKLFPYERDLARREVSALGLKVLSEAEATITAQGELDSDQLVRLTYFRSIVHDGTVVEPALAALERLHLSRRGSPTRPRQVTRYGVHGLHEYKGKFHPQMVRAFANLLDVRPGDLVLDPFCGSGTTLIEASLLGAHSAGIDLSPVAVELTRAKVAALGSLDPAGLALRLASWRDDVIPRVIEGWDSGSAPTPTQLDGDALAYLSRWFQPTAFAALSVTLIALDELADDLEALAVARIAVSSILRATSEQAPEDLRIRRRSSHSPAEPFPQKLQKALDLAIDAIEELSGSPRPKTTSIVELGDVTQPDAVQRLRGDAARATVITSPPYATALPYVDTDRLSLVALGLLKPRGLHVREAELIGSREWRRHDQVTWSDARTKNHHDLPDEVTGLLDVIEGSASNGGFRRRAVPGLLYRYFSQMADAFASIRQGLRIGEKGVFIVGVNRTGTGSSQVIIDTPRLLAKVAETKGFEVVETIHLDTWPRYGLHHENGVQGESAIVLNAR